MVKIRPRKSLPERIDDGRCDWGKTVRIKDLGCSRKMASRGETLGITVETLQC
jgi:hypothetical protein